MAEKIIAVDFDGTLCTDEWSAIGLPRKTVIDYVLDQQKEGAKLILWTNRNGDRLRDAVLWCTRFGIHFDAVNENLPEVVEQYGADTRKVYADKYIDDRAFSAFDLTELVRSAHENAVEHGFWEDPPDFGTSIALIHSELSEALEEVRADNRIRPGFPTPPVYYSGGGGRGEHPHADVQQARGVRRGAGRRGYTDRGPVRVYGNRPCGRISTGRSSD